MSAAHRVAWIGARNAAELRLAAPVIEALPSPALSNSLVHHVDKDFCFQSEAGFPA